MKKITLALATATALSTLFLPLASHADERIPVLSTQELVKECKFPASPESRSFCIGYTTAIYDTYLATRHPQRAKPFICVKQPGPTRDEVIGEFVKFAESAPQLGTQPASGTVLGFLAMRFPCAKK